MYVGNSSKLVTFCTNSYHNNYIFEIQLQIKVYKMANDRLAAARFFAMNPPHPVVGVHVLKDLVTKSKSRAQY